MNSSNSSDNDRTDTMSYDEFWNRLGIVIDKFSGWITENMSAELEEEEDRPKYKPPRIERKYNRLSNSYKYVRNKNSRKMMYGSQKWNR